MLLIVHLFDLRRWDVTDRTREPLVLKPGHPVKRGEFHIIESLPGAVSSNNFRLEQPITDSASALSWESPWFPTDGGSIPDSESRSV